MAFIPSFLHSLPVLVSLSLAATLQACYRVLHSYLKFAVKAVVLVYLFLQ